MTIKDQILDEMHKKFGICGHCGKKECGGKSTNSRLPDTLDTDELLAILDKVLSE